MSKRDDSRCVNYSAWVLIKEHHRLRSLYNRALLYLEATNLGFSYYLHFLVRHILLAMNGHHTTSLHVVIGKEFGFSFQIEQRLLWICTQRAEWRINKWRLLRKDTQHGVLLAKPTELDSFGKQNCLGWWGTRNWSATQHWQIPVVWESLQTDLAGFLLKLDS